MSEKPDEKRYEPGFSKAEIEELDRIHAETAAEMLKMMQSSPVPEHAPLVRNPK